jgi:hypothetical protein
MTGVERDAVVPFGARRGEARRRPVAPHETVAMGVRLLRSPQVDDQLLGFVQVVHSEIVDL